CRWISQGENATWKPRASITHCRTHLVPMARALGKARVASGSVLQVICMGIFWVLERENWARPEAEPVVQADSERPNRCLQKEPRARMCRQPRTRSMAGGRKTAESRSKQMENTTRNPKMPCAISRRQTKWTSTGASAQIHMTACNSKMMHHSRI